VHPIYSFPVTVHGKGLQLLWPDLPPEEATTRAIAASWDFEYTGGRMVVEALSTAETLPVINLDAWLHDSGDAAGKDALCKQVAELLKETGCLVVRDPRVDTNDNDTFLDMMERYYERGAEEKLAETRPELSYQVGYTPEGAEVPRVVQDKQMQAAIAAQPESDKAVMPTGPDIKCRYMWPLRRGERTVQVGFEDLNAECVSPQGIPEWGGQMDGWGEKMLGTVETVAEMAAVGFGLPADAFTSLMRNAPHILAPTGSNLARHSQLGACYAGYHSDLNFLTIHGKSRFPGLFVWLRDGRRTSVAIPDGCLLLQAGKQLEWLTGGAVEAGMHEVVCTEATRRAIAQAQDAGRSTWRVSSTVFSHIASDQLLQPLGHFAALPLAKEKFPPTLAGEQVRQDLELISLKAK